MPPSRDEKSTQETTVQLKAGSGRAEPVSAPVGEAPTGAAAPPVARSPRGRALRDPAVTPAGGAPSDPLVGEVIGDRYRILSPLAQGGMGSVYLAEQLTLNRQVAVKVIVQPSAELIERFRREAVALSEVSHPAIVEILDFAIFGEGESSRGCLVMAFIDGKDLGDYLDSQPSGRLDPREVRILMLPVVSALVELHANGILHRDIKPDNIVRFVRADGRAGVKLVDFGIARRQVDQGMTASGYVLGTPPYLPPETMLGEKHTPLSDVYALGATMFELLTSTPPYGHGSAAEVIQRALAKDVAFPDWLAPTAIGRLLREMLNRLPGQRPDAMQVLQRLETMRDPGAAEPAPEGQLRPTRPLAPVGAGPAMGEQPPGPGAPALGAAGLGGAPPSGGHLGRLPSTSKDLPALDDRPRVQGSHVAVVSPADPSTQPVSHAQRPGSRSGALILGMVLGALLGGALAVVALKLL